jgi:hypothetical protein
LGLLPDRATSAKVINAPPYAGAAASDVVVLFSKATGTGVRGVVSSVNVGAGTITLNANLGLALAPGDTVHLMAAAGQPLFSRSPNRTLVPHAHQP